MSHLAVRFENPKTRAGFTQLPNAILFDPDLSHAAKVTYAVLSYHAFRHGYGWASQGTLGRELGVSDRSVRSYLTELRRARLIRVTRRGLGASNLVSVCDPPDRKVASELERQGASREEESELQEENTSARADQSVPESEAPLSYLLARSQDPCPTVTNKGWANQERRMFEQDHRDRDHAEELLRWAIDSPDWLPQLDTMGDFRAKFDLIEADASLA